MTSRSFDEKRRAMVEMQIAARGISDPRLLAAFLKVPRHRFVGVRNRERSYEDRPLPIGPGQTVSQPYVVALMIDRLKVGAGDEVLEIGSGSGYQTALLAELAQRVFGVELSQRLARVAQRRLRVLGYANVNIQAGDGWAGWPEDRQFSRIIVSAACPEIPRKVVRQLAPGGRMILPFGAEEQHLVLLERLGPELVSRDLGAVRFVPLKQGEDNES